jgi:hypothetical protein
MIRIGFIIRKEDLHGVSGTGKIAEVVEFSNGRCVVSWTSPHSSTNVYDNVKHVEAIHSHGGKTNIEWIWEQKPDPDPMDALKDGAAEKPTLTDDELTEIATKAVEVAQKKVGEKIAQKLSEAPDKDEIPEDKR